MTFDVWMRREFLMDEMVKSIDALSRAQFRQLVMGAGAGAVRVPLLLPGGGRGSVPLAPAATPRGRAHSGTVRLQLFRIIIGSADASRICIIGKTLDIMLRSGCVSVPHGPPARVMHVTPSYWWKVVCFTADQM